MRVSREVGWESLNLASIWHCQLEVEVNRDRLELKLELEFDFVLDTQIFICIYFICFPSALETWNSWASPEPETEPYHIGSFNLFMRIPLQNLQLPFRWRRWRWLIWPAVPWNMCGLQLPWMKWSEVDCRLLCRCCYYCCMPQTSVSSTECYTSRRKQTQLLGSFARGKRDNCRLLAFQWPTSRPRSCKKHKKPKRPNKQNKSQPQMSHSGRGAILPFKI